MSETDTKKSVVATTIDEVIERLDVIIERAREENSRAGYFAALYRKVTVRVRDGIADGDFEDGERMERLDVIFANRYLDAMRRFQESQQPTKSWLVALESAEIWRLLIIQHLLLGINAHINLDLGIAAARTSPGDALHLLRNDFFKINKILSDLLDVVQEEINTLSPGFNLVDKVGGRNDEAIMNFSIERARDEAWNFARELAPLSIEEQERKLSEKDLDVELLANIVRNPGFLINIVAFFIRIFEKKGVKKVIDVLV